MVMKGAPACPIRFLFGLILFGCFFPITGKSHTPNPAQPISHREKPPIFKTLPLPLATAFDQQEKAEAESNMPNDGNLDILPADESQDPLVQSQDPAAVSEIAPPENINGNTGKEADGFNWGAAVRESLLFTGLMHSFRLTTQARTRAELRGPFFKDYFRSIRGLNGWSDGDPFIVNYIGHPVEGAISGYIQIQNDPKGIRQEFGIQKSYWKSRVKAMGFAALFSTQYELGPLSDASLGNVGMKPAEKSKHPKAWVDMVITPTLGTAWLVGEDMLDQLVMRRIESKFSNRLIRALVRSFLNPSRSMANVLRFKYPWRRDGRPL